MGRLKWMLAFLFSLCCCSAHADSTYGFVRIACVPENGLLDVEYRPLHDTVAGEWGQKGHNQALRRQGYYPGRGLEFSCTLGNVTYQIKGTQDMPDEAMCGGDPEIHLSVTRNGAPFLNDVIFGESCNQFPSIQSFTVGDGPAKPRPPEAQVCYLPGPYGAAQSCDWAFEQGHGEFLKHFPIDQKAVARFVARLKR